MNAPLEDIAFLAGSPSRVQVLEILAEAPQTRDELYDSIDVSRATLRRVLRDLEDRTWITRTDQTYTVTSLGAFVIDAFADLMDTMETEARLRQVMPWFPTEAVPFGIRRLSEAEIVVPSETNFTAHVHRAIEVIRSADRFRTVAYQTAPSIVEATNTAVTEHGLRFEAVLATNLFETLLDDPAIAPTFSELLAAPTADVYQYDDEIPVGFVIADDVVGFPLTDADEVPQGVMISDDETVYAWATETFETFRNRAELLVPEEFDIPDSIMG